MLSSIHFMIMGLQALLRNRVQTALAMVGVMVGVGALVASMALGRGAQESIKDQLLAAGANMIVVTAGNYSPQKTQGTEAPADHARFTPPADPREFVAKLFAARNELIERGYAASTVDQAIKTGASMITGVELSRGGFLRTHFEDDPMAEHDHPTAKERLGDSMAGLGAAATLTLEDADAIREKIPGVQFAASGVHENARVTVEGDSTKQWFTRLHGTESKLPGIRRGWVFPYGEFLSEEQVEKAEQVMVLGQFAATKLFGEGVDPVGQSILLWNQSFKVVGVVGSTSWAAQPVAGDDQFDAIYVPVTTVHRLLNLSKLNTITVTTASAGDTTRIAGEIIELLRQRHGISETMADDFTVKTQAQEMLGKGLSPELARIVGGNLATMEQLTIEQLSVSLQRSNRTMLALLAGVATVSLLVGGIGVMNLLLLSVSQRTREVGLRMALGARRWDIARQFVSEAVVLSLIGGVLGAGLGMVAASSLEEFFQWSTVVSPISTAIAVLVAAILGVASGVYPARRAAQLDPIGALQHE